MIEAKEVLERSPKVYFKLVNAVQALSMAKNIEEVMGIVRTAARELTGADGATFVLRDKDQCYYADEDAISPLWKGSRFPLATCISGWTMLNKQAAVIPDIYEDPRIPFEAYKPTFVKSLAMVPIRKDDPLGAIGNYWAKNYTPSEEEISLIQALADITAVSIENINIKNSLEQQVKDRTEELHNALTREQELSHIKSAFVSMASHEFRTPLGAILSSTTLAEKYNTTEQQDKREKHFKRIKVSVRTLIDILNDFLSVDKLEQGKIRAEQEHFNFKEFVDEVLEELDPLRKTGQEVQLSFTGSGDAYLDKKMTRNVLLNLLSNAIKYSEDHIQLTIELTSDVVRISVTDHGIGIPAEQKAKIFSKFFRADNVNGIQGTGLGLNIVQHYVELQGGNINFVSEPGKTTFTVIIPQ